MPGKNIHKRAYSQICQMVTAGHRVSIEPGAAREFEVTVFHRTGMAHVHYEGNALCTVLERAFLGEPYELVRPGKSQPTCECDEKVAP